MSTHRHTALNPIMIGMQVGLQILFAGVLAFVIAVAVLNPSGDTPAIVTLSLLVGATYVMVLLAHAATSPRRQRVLRAAGLLAMIPEGLVLVWLTPQASYLLLPLAFVYLELLPAGIGVAVIAGSTLVAVLLAGVRSGWTIGGVAGPLLGAGIAILIGLSHRALRQERAEYERLYADLLATQGRLAASERDAGVLAERSRLAREIHDTVAQSLSSITLLLHAVERADPEAAGIDKVRLARDTATASLAETRRFIRELTPPLLDEQTLGGALRRLADGEWVSPGLVIEVRAADALSLPMATQTALLRVAQGAMANVRIHAHASHAMIELTQDADTVRLMVTDNGVGMDPVTADRPGADGRDSFGLRATRERIGQLGGTVTLTSSPGNGTTLSVQLPIEGR